jgi:hypothetical protein
MNLASGRFNNRNLPSLSWQHFLLDLRMLMISPELQSRVSRRDYTLDEKHIIQTIFKMGRR